MRDRYTLTAPDQVAAAFGATPQVDAAAPPPAWITTPVSRRFTDAAVDDAACIKPLPDPAAQLALF